MEPGGSGESKINLPPCSPDCGRSHSLLNAAVVDEQLLISFSTHLARLYSAWGSWGGSSTSPSQGARGMWCSVVLHYPQDGTFSYKWKSPCGPFLVTRWWPPTLQTLISFVLLWGWDDLDVLYDPSSNTSVHKDLENHNLIRHSPLNPILLYVYQATLIGSAPSQPLPVGYCSAMSLPKTDTRKILCVWWYFTIIYEDTFFISVK